MRPGTRKTRTEKIGTAASGAGRLSANVRPLHLSVTQPHHHRTYTGIPVVLFLSFFFAAAGRRRANDTVQMGQFECDARTARLALLPAIEHRTALADARAHTHTSERRWGEGKEVDSLHRYENNSAGAHAQKQSAKGAWAVPKGSKKTPPCTPWRADTPRALYRIGIRDSPRNGKVLRSLPRGVCVQAFLAK